MKSKKLRVLFFAILKALKYVKEILQDGTIKTTSCVEAGLSRSLLSSSLGLGQQIYQNYEKVNKRKSEKVNLNKNLHMIPGISRSLKPKMPGLLNL